MVSVRVQFLTRDTSFYLFYACYGSVDLVTFLTENIHDYIIPGYFPLEKEFNKLRQESRGA